MIVDEPVRGTHAVHGMLGLPGREQIERFVAGLAAPPPLHHLLGLKPTACGDGTSEFTMPASPWLASHLGVVPGGLLAVLADGPLGCALQTTLPAGVHYTTAELSMSYLRPVTPAGGLITARGRVIHAGRSLGLTETTVVGPDGREVAHSNSRCFVFPPAAELPEPPPARPYEPPDFGSPDPWQRPVEGEVADPAELAKRTGLECWLGVAHGELPPPPVHLLTGFRAVDGEEGRVTAAMPATGWHTSPAGTVEGGFLVYLADGAAAAAAATLAPAGTVAAPIDITVKFLRPVFPDSRDLLAYGRVVHAGRSLAVTATDVRNLDGKLVATAVGSSMLVRERALAAVAVEDESTG